MKYVRLKPFNGRNHVKKTHTVFGIKFQAEKGWYKVDDDVAEYLKDVPQQDHGPDADYSAKAFDVVDSQQEATKLEAKEKEQAKRRSPFQAERKIRVHTADASRTMPMQVHTNLPQTKTLKPSPMAQRSASIDAPKWAHADRVVGRAGEGVEDDTTDEFLDDEAEMPKAKRSSFQRIDGDADDVNPDEVTEHHDPEDAERAEPKARGAVRTKRQQDREDEAAHGEVAHANEETSDEEEVEEGEEEGHEGQEGSTERRAGKKKRRNSLAPRG